MYRSTKQTTGYTLIASTANTVYNNRNLVPGTKYFYKVRSYVESGGATYYSVFTSPFAGTPIPSAPTTISAKSATTTATTVTWSAVTGASGYEISYKASSAVSYTTAGFSAAAVRSYQVNGLGIGVTYDFRVRAYCDVNNVRTYGEYSQPANNTQSPAVPTNLTLTGTGTTSLKATWTAVQGVSQYQIYTSTDNATFTLAQTVNTNSATLIALQLGVRLYVKVRCVVTLSSTENAYSSFTAVKNATPMPGAPVLKMDPYKPSGIALSWKEITGVSGYVLYKKDSATGAYYQLTKIMSATVTSYQDTNVAIGDSPYYKVTAFVTPLGGTDVEGADSNVVGQQVRPSTPQLEAASNNAVSTALTWNSVDCTGYLIKRSTKATSGFTKLAVVDASDVSYTDRTVTSGTRYYYQIWAYKRVGSVNVYGVGSAIRRARFPVARPT